MLTLRMPSRGFCVQRCREAVTGTSASAAGSGNALRLSTRHAGTAPATHLQGSQERRKSRHALARQLKRQLVTCAAGNCCIRHVLPHQPTHLLRACALHASGRATAQARKLAATHRLRCCPPGRAHTPRSACSRDPTAP